MSSILQLLEAAQTPSNQSAAEAQLTQLSQGNFPSYLTDLCGILAQASISTQTRSLAGILIKNALTGHSSTFISQKTNAYLAIDPATRTGLKSSLVSLFSSNDADKNILRATAQAVAAIALIELPRNEFPECIPALTTGDLSPAKLSCLGYICEALPTNILPGEQVNLMLNCLSNALNSAAQNEELLLSSIGALLNAIDFCGQNMENAGERMAIFGMIVTACSTQFPSVRAVGFECVARLASTYYHLLEEFMPKIYDLSFNAIKSDEEMVAMQALEFWSTLAEEEIYNSQSNDGSKPNSYVAKVVNELTPVVLNCLTKQEEDQERGTRNMATSGALCLSLMAQLLGGVILSIVLPFVESNINSSDWRAREGSLVAFAALMDGTNPVPVSSAFDIILSKALNTYEQVPMVRDSALWAISQICASTIYLGQLFTTPGNNEKFENLTKVLLKAMEDEPRVRHSACYAINCLASTSNPQYMDELFMPFVSKLLDSHTGGSDEWDVLANAYEAINSLVMSCSAQTQPLCIKLLEELLRRLSLSMNGNDPEAKKLRLYLVGCIQTVVMKLGSACAVELVDKVMEGMVKLLGVHSELCLADCFMTVASVANALEGRFERYINHILPLLLANGLKNREEPQVNQTAVGCLCDMFRNLEGKGQLFHSHINEIMATLLENLGSEDLSRDVKPATLGALGEAALCLSRDFGPFLNQTMGVLFAAANTKFEPGDEDMELYMSTLRENILEALSGVIQGMGGQGMESFVEGILRVVATVALESNVGAGLGVCKAAVGLLGDLGVTFGEPVKEKIRNAGQHVRPLFAKCQEDTQAKQTAQWAMTTIGLS